MKKIWPGLVLLLAMTAILQQCTDDGDAAVGVQKVQFTFSYKASDATGGRVQQDVVPDALLLSVERAPGDPVFISKRIALLRVGLGYITEPIEMTPGSYTITDFMLAAGDSVIYLTPLQGSPLAPAVNHPLPYPLVVSNNQSSTIDMEVIATGTNPPEDFGYAAFAINTINPLRVSVFSGTNLTNATAYVLESWDTTKIQNLGATINFLSIPGRAHVYRKLIISKPGYSSVIVPFYYDQLIDSLQGVPLKVILEPAVFTIQPAATTYSMQLMGKPGTLHIDWGDGTSEPFTLSEEVTPVTHNYFSAGCCPVNITGDIDRILSLRVHNSDISAINVKGLSSLIEIWLRYMQGPTEIDFTHNPALYILFMPSVSRLKHVKLPPASVFQSYMIDVNAPNQMATADIDALIDQAYVQATPGIAGIFQLTDPSTPNGFVGPPSPAGMAKLRVLRDVDHWYIDPNP